MREKTAFNDELKAAVRFYRRRRQLPSVQTKKSPKEHHFETKEEVTFPLTKEERILHPEARALGLVKAWCEAAAELESQDLSQEDAVAGGLFLLREAVGDDAWALPCLDAWKQCVATVFDRRTAKLGAEWRGVLGQRLAMATVAHISKRRRKTLFELLRLIINACSLPGDTAWASVHIFQNQEDSMHTLALDQDGCVVLEEDTKRHTCLEAQFCDSTNLLRGEAYLAQRLNEDSDALDTVSAKVDNYDVVLTILIKGGIEDESLFEARRFNLAQIAKQLAPVFFDTAPLAGLWRLFVAKAIQSILRRAFCTLKKIVVSLRRKDNLFLTAAAHSALLCLAECRIHATSMAANAQTCAIEARALLFALDRTAKQERKLTRRAAAVSARCRQLEIQNRTLSDQVLTMRAAAKLNYGIPSSSRIVHEHTQLTPTSLTHTSPLAQESDITASPLTPTSTPTRKTDQHEMKASTSSRTQVLGVYPASNLQPTTNFLHNDTSALLSPAADSSMQ